MILHHFYTAHLEEMQPHSHLVPSLEEQMWRGTVMAAHVGSQEPVQLYRKIFIIQTLGQSAQSQI